jgi:hypothetical protein
MLPLWPCLLFAGAVLCVYAYLAWTLRSSELTESDEPAHFTTSVMVFEYLRTALGANPMGFAQSFYIRFPKVMFGHWPPGFYVVQAAAFFLTGPTQAAAKAVCGAIAFTIAGVLIWRVRLWNGWASAILAGSVFLAIRDIQLAAWQIMSDVLTGLFMVLAILAFSDFLDSLDGKSAGRFLMWSVLAILTKGSAWSLGIFALLAPLLTGRWACFRSRWYWIPGAVTFALGAPFYWLTRSAGIGYSQDVVTILARTRPTLNALTSAVSFFTPLLLGITIVGFGAALYRRWMCGEETREVRDSLCAASGILAQFLFLLLLPLTLQDRYFIPSGALAAILFAQWGWLSTLLKTGGAGHRPAQSKIGPNAGSQGMFPSMPATLRRCAALAPLLLAIGVLAESRFPTPYTITGFRAAARSIPFQPQGSVILVSSDAIGEGDWVADRLESDPWKAGVVLRASNVLAFTRMGQHYRLRLPDSEAVIEYLHSTAVRYIVVDHCRAPSPHQILLDDALRRLSGEYRQIGSFPVRRGSTSSNVDVFASNSVDRNPPEIRLPGRPSWGAWRMRP